MAGALLGLFWPGAAPAQLDSADGDTTATGGGIVAGAVESRMFLEVFINGSATGLVGHFIETDGQYALPRSQFEGIGLVPPPAGPQDGPDTPIVLAEVPGLAYAIDQRAQTIDIDVPFDLVQPNVITVRPRNQRREAETGRGVVFGYDVLATSSEDQSGDGVTGDLSSTLGFSAFSEWGVLDSSHLLRTDSNDSSDAESFVRLDTAWTYDDQEDVVTYRVGDGTSDTLAWSRSLRFGGAQVERDFGIRPDIVTVPISDFYGDVAAPSTVDLFVNGLQRASNAVAPGPFAVRDLPLNTGANSVAVTTTDAFGREVVVETDVYIGPQLLAPGLTDFSVEGGATRQSFGELSNDYDTPFVSGTWRRGQNDWLTLQGHAEVAEDLFLGGGGLAFLVSDWAEASFDLAGSGGDGGGGLVSASFERQALRYSFGLRATLTSDGFRDVAALEGIAYPKRLVTASAGYSFDDWGSASIAIADSAEHDGEVDEFGGFIEGDSQRSLTASYSLEVWPQAWLIASAFQDLLEDGNRSVSLNLTMPLGLWENTRLDTGITFSQGETPSANVDMRQDNGVGEVSWQVGADTGQFSSINGLVEYDGFKYDATLRAGRSAGSNVVQGNVSGGVIWMDGGFFLIDEVRDAFALVSVPGIQGVRVYRENRLAGFTDEDGYALISELGSYDNNSLSIDTADVPIDVALARTSAIVVPRRRSGMLVEFGARQSASAVVMLVMPDGAPAPMGATVAGTAMTTRALVGYGGETYLTDLQPQNRIELLVRGRHLCTADFAFTATPSRIPRLGPVTCTP